MTSKTPSIAVIGSGYWGKNLIRSYHNLGALKLICDKNETLLSKFKEQYSGIDTCLALNDVLSQAHIKGIVIATPAETHYTLACEALLSGKDVFIEKPMALREEEALKLISLAKERNLVLMVGHLLQYHPVFIRLKELTASGKLGRINYMYSHRLNLGKIRREENILWSFAPHDISMILSLAGEFPEKVFATGGNYLHKRIADVTTTHLEFPSGIRAHIFVSWLHPFKEQKLVVVGDQKMAVFDDTKQWHEKLLLYSHEVKWQNNIPVPIRADPERFDIPKDEPLRLECKHFLECISSRMKPITDGYEGIKVLKILNYSQQCLDGHGSYVTQVRIEGDKKYFSHETSVIDEGTEIGADTKIWHFSHIFPNTKIGKNCNIGQNVVIGPDVSIGHKCKIQNNVSVYKGVTLEDDVFCGPSMVFTNVFNPRACIPKMDEVRPTLVRKGATIGANATIICGVTLGRYCFVGAGAVVTKSVPDYAIVVGNPAKQIGWMCECGEQLTDKLGCPSCKKQFNMKPDSMGLILKR